MRKYIWKVDDNNLVEFKMAFFTKNKVLLNGQEVARQTSVKNQPYSFTLNNGRSAEITLTRLTSGYDVVLRVEGEVILSEAEQKQIACLRCGTDAKPGDKFCEKCGAEMPKADTQRKIIKLKSARKNIAAVAVMFVFAGVVMFFIQSDTDSKGLAKIASYKDADVYPNLVNGQQYTVGELRSQLQMEPWTVLGTNLILALVMFGLFLYAKKSPLVAMIMALGVYVAVVILDAIVDPKSIGQGLYVKIIFIAILVNGIKSALELRKVTA